VTNVLMFMFGIAVGITIGVLCAVIVDLQKEIEDARRDGHRR